MKAEKKQREEQERRKARSGRTIQANGDNECGEGKECREIAMGKRVEGDQERRETR